MNEQPFLTIESLCEPIPIKDIDFRIQSINKGGYATILPYKDARVDINRLNAVCGPLGWSRSHSRDNKNCTVSIYDENRKHWVSKEDTGIESFAAKQKGLASDSFKRACFNWGIGLELYDYPFISVKLHSDEFRKDGDSIKATFNLRLKEWKWEAEFINDKLVKLFAMDQKGIDRYRWEGELERIVGEVTGDLLDTSKVLKAYLFFKERIDEDEDEPNYKQMQYAAEKLHEESADYISAVMNLFGNSKPEGSRRFYRTILGDCLEMPLHEDGTVIAQEVEEND